MRKEVARNFSPFSNKLFGPFQQIVRSGYNARYGRFYHLINLYSHGNFDILINNTGGPAPGVLLNDAPEKLGMAFRQHIVVSQLLAQLVVPSMKEKAFGRIINIISNSVKAPIPGLGTSNVIRGATVIGLCQRGNLITSSLPGSN